MNTQSDNARFAILLDGPVTATPRLTAQLAGRRVIAADGGIRHATSLSLQPELWVGDFDSAEPELLERYLDVPRQSHPPRKAKSDGEIALEAAIKLAAQDILVIGVSGGSRSDHVLFNLSAMMGWAAKNDGKIMASNGLEEHYPIAPGTPFSPDLPQKTTVSVFGFGPLQDVSIDGAHWPLNNVQVEFGSSLTLSNIVHGAFTVTVQSGHAILVAYLNGAFGKMPASD